MLGDAFVVISPYSVGFRALADAQIKKALAGLKADIPVDLNTKPALATMASLKARMTSLGKLLAELRIDADSKAAEAKIAKLQALLIALAGRIKTIKFDVDAKGVVAAEAALLGLEAAAVGMKRATDGASTSAALFTGNIGRWGIGLLGARVALFGGIAAVGGFHLALDAAVEILAIAVPALTVLALGLGSFAAAALLAQDAAGRVADHLRAVQTVSAATGAQISPLTNKFNNLAGVIRPQVWQLYGDAIDLSRNKMGLIGTLAEKTGSVLDRFAARLVADITQGGKGISSFIAAGQKDLAQLGGILATLGNAFANLIKVAQQTGIANILLDIVGAAAKLLDVITRLPTPLLAIIIGLHGLYLWGGLAVTALTGMGRGVAALITSMLTLAEKTGIIAATSRTLSDAEILAGAGAAGAAEKTGLWATATGALSKIPVWGWVAAGAIVLTGLVIMLARSKDATDRWAASLDKMVAASTVFNVINRTEAALSQSTQKLISDNSALSKQLAATTTGAAAFDKGVRAGIGTMQIAAHDADTVRAEHAKLSDQLAAELSHVGAVSHAYGTTLVGSLALASVAGVRVSDLMSTNSKVWATALQQIDGVVQGYRNMGQGAGQLASDINALTVANSDQLAAINKVNTAYDTFTKIVSGPIDTFLTFAQGLVRFSNDAKAAGAQITGFGGATVAVSHRVTTASIQLQQDFQASFASAEQLFDAMRTSGAPAAIQVKAIKDTVAVLIPLAGTNKAAAAEISALAQEAGGPGTTNLQTLNKWAGVTANQGLTGLQKDTQNAAVAFSNLSLDAQKLSTTLQQDLTNAMALAAFQARGGQKAFNDFAAGVVHGDTSSRKFAAAAVQVADELIKSSGSAGNAKPIFESFARSLGLSKTAADQLWTATLNATGGVLNFGAAAAGTHFSRAQLNADVTALWKQLPATTENLSLSSHAIANQQIWLGRAHTALSIYTADILGNTSATSRGKADRAALIADLEKGGLSARAATGFVDGLSLAISRVPSGKSTTFTEHVTPATFKISTTPGSVADPIGELHLSAKGSRVPGYGGGDRHLYALEGGEAVVSKETTARHAATLGAWGVPGFAGGGLVPDTGYLGGRIDTAVHADVGAALRLDLAASIRQDMQAAAAVTARAVAAAAAAGPGGGTARANAALARRLYPMYASGPVWDAWNYVAMRESGWNQYATNPSSGAYGIPQALPPTKMPFAAQRAGGSNPTAQIRWMFDYMAQTYGGPIGAAAHERAFNWYGAGTASAAPGWAVVGERGVPELVRFRGGESVTPMRYAGAGGVAAAAAAPGQPAPDLASRLDALGARLDALLRLTAGAPHAHASALAGALNGVAHDAGAAGRYSRRG